MIHCPDFGDSISSREPLRVSTRRTRDFGEFVGHRERFADGAVQELGELGSGASGRLRVLAARLPTAGS